MSERIFKKGLVVGIIVLFLGVGFQPAFAKEIISTISNNEDDCNCDVVSKSELLRFERLLTRFKLVIKSILMRYRNIPEIEEKCNEILNILNIDKILENPYRLGCKILYEIMNRYLEKLEKFIEILYILLGEDLALRIVNMLGEFLLLPVYTLMILYVLLLCEEYPITLDKLNISDFVMQLNFKYRLNAKG